MARSQAADYDEKRHLILQKAAELFAKKGFSGAPVSDLATNCAISKSLIYHYYSSKEAILFAAMMEHMDTLVKITCERETEKASPDDEFRAVTNDLLHCYIGAANYQKILLYELDFLPPEQRKEIISKQRKVINKVASLLSQKFPKFAARKKLLRAKVMLYFGMMNWTHTWYKPLGPLKRTELADEITNSTLKSFGD